MTLVLGAREDEVGIAKQRTGQWERWQTGWGGVFQEDWATNCVQRH